MLFWLLKLGIIIFIVQLVVGGILFWYHGAFKKRVAIEKKMSFRLLYKEVRSHSSNAGNLISELKEQIKEKFNQENSKFITIFHDYFALIEEPTEMRTIVGVILDDHNKFEDKASETEFCGKHSMKISNIKEVSF